MDERFINAPCVCLSDEEMSITKRVDAFSIGKLAIANSLLLMEGKFGGGFYIKFLQDEGTKYGWLHLTILYPDNSFKGIILYKNYLKETDTECNNGVFVGAQESRKKIQGSFNDDITKNYASLKEYETPIMPIPTATLWKLIVDNYDKIPIVKINQTATVEQLLLELQQRAAEKAKITGNEFMDTESHFYLSADDFREIIESNGWYVNAARTQFDLMGLFVKNSATNSYQKSKRVNGEYQRFYVLRKDCEAKYPETKSLQDTEYKTGYQTKEQKEIANLIRKNELLLEKYNKLAEERGMELEI